MNHTLILAILIMGLSGITAQALILRELLVSFYGNELILGVILANWVILEAAGVLILGKLIEKIRNKINIFVILETAFSLALPLSIYLSRVFKDLLGIRSGEGIGLYAVFYSSFFIILPVSFCHGALFSVGAKVYSLYRKEAASSVGKVFSLETIGTIIGGVILTYFFIPHLNSFQITFIITISNLIVCLFFLKEAAKVLKYICLCSVFLVMFFGFTGRVHDINKSSVDRQWKQGEVLEYRNSVYGNITVVRKGEQNTFFYNGSPVITIPYPDITFMQEFGNLPLLFHREPSDILILSRGAGGLINEILKHPVKRIDYAELDPLIIRMLDKYPSGLTQREIKDEKVNIKNLDGRLFLKETGNKYDLILIGLSNPQDLSTNRYFTQELFLLSKKKLKERGILALWLPGSLTYLSQELKDLNACILNGLKYVYASVRIIPGDYNIILASESKDILKVEPGIITQRIQERGIKDTILLPGHLAYRLSPAWTGWFDKSMASAIKKVNRDFQPLALYQALLLWNKQFSDKFMHYFYSLKDLNLAIISVLIFVFFSVLFLLIRVKPALAKLSVAYSILSTGFFGMLANLILIFSFQVLYGYLYHRIGLLISVFMAGIALGSISMTGVIRRAGNIFRLFICLEMLVIIFTYIMALTITGMQGPGNYPSFIFIILFFISGLLLGLEFPAATKIYMGRSADVGLASGVLYGSDLIGGWLGGVLGSILFLPFLGLFNTCILIIIVKLSSLLLLLLSRPSRFTS